MTYSFPPLVMLFFWVLCLVFMF
ncbi:hypothetical protein NC652_035517 [Populus alba x Populus x berolinensis]|nr:hypothetical protein NC652_035517 [Populus alba x Populus x berolinensis]